MSQEYFEYLDVEQGSDLWLQERMKRVTASQVPTLLGLSKYQSVLELFEEKITGREQEVTGYKKFLFAKGHDAEIAARAWIETHTGNKFPPAVLLSKKCPDLMASLDGFNSEKNIIFEAKFMGKEALEDVKKGKIKPYHECQVQAQLLASGAEKCIYFATIKGGDSAVLEIKPKSDYATSISEAIDKFMLDLKEALVCKQTYQAAVERSRQEYQSVIERLKSKHARKTKDPFRIKRRYK